MSASLTYDSLVAACTSGGAGVLTMRTELAPAAGQEAGIAPARYLRGSNAAYAFETRFATDPETGRSEAVKTVVIDSKGSSLNRVEQELSLAIRDNDPLISLTPRIQVTYAGRETDHHRNQSTLQAIRQELSLIHISEHTSPY